MENKDGKMAINFMKKPYLAKDVENILNPTVKKWFFSRFREFSLPQLYGVMEIHKRQNILVSAPTGATKTLTAFLAILNELVDSAEKGILENKIYCVYISPLKALSNDIEKNLLEPLKEMEAIAGKEFGIRIGVRTGDTTQQEKSEMLQNPPHILITTPESLAILLVSYKFVNHLVDVQWCIVDEIHALAENKRGVHLSLSLERLGKLSSSMTRIGLSATIAPLEDVACFLAGFHDGKQRDCEVVDVQFIKDMDLRVLCPVPDLINVSHSTLHHQMYSLIDKLIQEHKTTLIFTNTRSATERVVDYLKEKFPAKYTENAQKSEISGTTCCGIGAHHGSLSKRLRLSIEDRLREGKLKCVVCLDGDSKILDGEGKWVKIKEIEKKSVQSVNKKLKINKSNIKNIFKTKNNESLLKLKTELGKEIKCTKNHKFLTISEHGDLVWKEADKLQEKEFIATIRKHYFRELKGEELDKFVFENYPDEYFVFLNKKFLNAIKLEIKRRFSTFKKAWRANLKDHLNYPTFIHALLGDYGFKIRILKKIIKILGTDEIETFKNICFVSSDKYKMSKIRISKEMMRLIGFMLADGYLSDRDLFISNKDELLLTYYRNLIEKICGKKPWAKTGSTGTPILGWSSKFLSQFLKNAGFKQGRKARTVDIPNFIFRLNPDLVFSFISGYLDGDGYLERKDGRVYSAGICTTSKNMAEDMSRLLLRENILSSIRSRYYDEIQELNGRKITKKGMFYTIVILGGDNLRKFAEKITPVRKNLKKIKSVLTLRGYTNRDVVPNLGLKLKTIRNQLNLSTYKLQKQGLNPSKYEIGSRAISRKQLKKLLSLYKSENSFLWGLSDSDLVWERIKSKEKIEAPEFVYNIEVENHHNYIANGFLTKNCSTSLELGIDIGYIDLVICLGSPKSVARALQRIGRSGHQLHEKTKGRIIVLNRDDLVECAVLLKSAVERKIDRIHIPKNCLDVLAQHIHGIALQQMIHANEMFKLIRQSYCYHSLDFRDFMQVVEYLAGRFVSLEDRHIYAKIWLDEETGMIGRKGRMTRVIHMTNIGTIPDETFITVKVGNDVIGKLDEAFLERLRAGDIFCLGGELYTFLYSRGMVAQAKPTSGRPPTIPSWISEMLPLSFDLANEIGRFRKLMNERLCLGKPKKEIIDFINEYLYVDANAANSIYEYFKDQFDYAQIPSSTRVIVEHYSDEKGKYVIFHSLLGRRVNDCLSRALAYAIAIKQHKNVELGINDNGFFIRTPVRVDVMAAFKLLKSKELGDVLNRAIDNTEVLKRRFRHCASRALMILRQYKGRQKNVGRQQVGSMILMSALKRIDPDFSILKEARREVLEDLMDIENTKLVLKGIEDKKIKVEEIFTQIPSPFAFNLIIEGYTDVLKMEDRLEFLRRMHEMVKAKISLKAGKQNL